MLREIMLFDELRCNVIHNTPLTTQVIKGSKHLKKRKKRTSDVKEFEKKNMGWKIGKSSPAFQGGI